MHVFPHSNVEMNYLIQIVDYSFSKYPDSIVHRKTTPIVIKVKWQKMI